MTLALAWSLEATPPPPGTRSITLPGLTLLTAPDPAPRDRLILQQACFDAGLDILPFAPAHPLTTERALATRPEALAKLRARLVDLRGMAQFSLQLQWDEEDHDGSWLAGRRQRHRQAEAARAWLSTEAQRLSAHTTPVSLRKTSAVTHMLAPRTAPPRPDPNGAPGACLTLVGPWPPHAFVAAA